MPPHDHEPNSRKLKQRATLGCTEQVQVARQVRRDHRSQDPWIARKLAVMIVMGLVAYSTYVYVRMCVDMIRERRGALGSRVEGIGLVSGFGILSFMFWWTYLKLILTPPGFARDYVPTSAIPYRPPHERAEDIWPTDSRTRTTSDSTNVDNVDISDLGTPSTDVPPTPSRVITGGDFDGRHDRVRDLSRADSDRGSFEKLDIELQQPTSVHRSSSRRTRHVAPGSAVPLESRSRSHPTNHSHSSHHSQRTQHAYNRNRHAELNEYGSYSGMHYDTSGYRQTDDFITEGELSASLENEHTLVHVSSPPSPNNMYMDPKLHPLAPKELSRHSSMHKSHQHHSNRSRSSPSATSGFQGAGSKEERGGHVVEGRRPPSQPVLKEERRFCYRCKHVKPMRAHHCRGCGTCVLMYDHHCPWIGQCVGAHNVKFFINFLEWAPLFTMYLFISLLILTIRGEDRNLGSIDPQHIVIIALAIFFSLFTLIMFLGHLRLTSINLTTVESLRVRDMIERERSILDRMAPIWRFRRRRQIEKEWDNEWGELHTEGNIWWLGSVRRNWEAKMGRNPLGWFLPIGRSEGDGLAYPINPRFTADGVWRRRKEWPPELQ